MERVNLIPAPRLAARRRRTHVRRCAAGCVAWGVLSVAVACGSHAFWRDVDPQSDERLGGVVEETGRTERAIAAARAQLAAAESTLRANQAIATQPDWSILLALLAEHMGEEVVLKNCTVHPADAGRTPARPDPRRTTNARAAAPAPPAQGPGYVMEASGLARSHAAANQFVLRMERSGLFSRVSLLDTAREPFMDREAIAFRVECSLQDQPAPADAAAAARGDQ